MGGAWHSQGTRQVQGLKKDIVLEPRNFQEIIMNCLEKSVWTRLGRTLVILLEVVMVPKTKGVPPKQLTGAGSMPIVSVGEGWSLSFFFLLL